MLFRSLTSDEMENINGGDLKKKDFTMFWVEFIRKYMGQ